MVEALAHDSDDDLVRNELARSEELLEPLAFFTIAAKGGAKNVPSGDMWNHVVTSQAHTLRALTGTLLAEDDKPRPRSLMVLHYPTRPMQVVATQLTVPRSPNVTSSATYLRNPS